jgi:hypothetical protein
MMATAHIGKDGKNTPCTRSIEIEESVSKWVQYGTVSREMILGENDSEYA